MTNPPEPAVPVPIQDLDAFRRAQAAGGGQLRDLVLSLDLSGVALSESSMTSVRALHVNWTNARIADSRFTNVSFLQCDFTRAELKNVTFSDCRFERCSFERATLKQCRLVNVAAEESNARYAKLESCVFESFEDRSGVFNTAMLLQCRFDRCLFDNSAFHGAALHNVAVKASRVGHVIFSGVHGDGLSFEDSVVEQCGFEDSSYGALEFAGGTTKGVTFSSFALDGLTMRNCERIEGLTVRDSAWNKVAITGCRMVAELTIERSRLKDLTVLEGGLAYLQLSETEISGQSRLINCRIEGLSLEGSTLRGTELATCTISGYLTLDRATFDAVVLRGMVYAPALEMRAQGVVYVNGAHRFPRT